MQMKMVEQDESLSFPSLDMGLVDMGSSKKDPLDVAGTSSFMLSDAVASARTHPPHMQLMLSGKRKAAPKRTAAVPCRKQLSPLSSGSYF